MNPDEIENIIKYRIQLDNLYTNYLVARDKALEKLNRGVPFEETQLLWDETLQHITEWQKLMKIQNDH